MKLTVLGKYGPFPPAGGATSGYLLRHGDTAIALDLGSGTLARLQQHVPLSALDAVVLSHLHLDHIADLLPLVYALGGKTLNLYLPMFDSPQYDLIASFDCFHLIPIFDRREIRVKDVGLTFCQMQHPVESYGVCVEGGGRKLFYSGDTVFHDKLIPCAASSDLLLLDCAQPSDHKGAPHMTLSEGALIARTTGKRVLATHVHPLYSPYAEAKTLGLEVAEEGASYSI